PDLELAGRARADVPHRARHDDLFRVGPGLDVEIDLEVRRARHRERRLRERRWRRRPLGRGGGGFLRAPGKQQDAGGDERRATRAQAAISAAALESTASPRSAVLAVSTIFPGASCHISVTIVSPGKTTPEKRTSKDLSRDGSLPQYAWRTARP